MAPGNIRHTSPYIHKQPSLQTLMRGGAGGLLINVRMAPLLWSAPCLHILPSKLSKALLLWSAGVAAPGSGLGAVPGPPPAPLGELGLLCILAYLC